MATKEQIFGILSGASGPMSRVELEEKVGEKYSSFQSQLDRWVKQGGLQNTGEHHYVLTDEGREELLKRTEFKEILGTEPAFIETPKQPAKQPATEELKTAVEQSQPAKPDEEPGLAGGGESQESLATTEYQQFLKLGKVTGVNPLALIKQTADYVWEGGDFRDMMWVAQAMKDMDIRQDLRGRWWNSWRVKMHKAIPAELPSEFFSSESRKSEEKTEAEKKAGTGKRDYILNADDYPTYVGEGLGDLDYKDALDLSKIRTTRGKSDGRPATTASSMAEDVAKIFASFKEVMGDRVAGKSFVVKPGDNGYQVEELDPSKPLIIPQPQAAKPGQSFYVGDDGVVKELVAGQPLVIVKEAPKPAAAGGTHYLIDNKSGEVKEVGPGQPVIIIRENAQSQSTPIQVKDKDGNPMVLDLGTFIKLEEHRDKQRREEESHETKMEIAKSFKDMLNLTGKALSNTIGGEGEEK